MWHTTSLSPGQHFVVTAAALVVADRALGAVRAAVDVGRGDAETRALLETVGGALGTLEALGSAVAGGDGAAITTGALADVASSRGARVFVTTRATATPEATSATAPTTAIASGTFAGRAGAASSIGGGARIGAAKIAPNAPPPLRFMMSSARDDGASAFGIVSRSARMSMSDEGSLVVAATAGWGTDAPSAASEKRTLPSFRAPMSGAFSAGWSIGSTTKASPHFLQRALTLHPFRRSSEIVYFAEHAGHVTFIGGSDVRRPRSVGAKKLQTDGLLETSKLG